MMLWSGTLASTPLSQRIDAVAAAGFSAMSVAPMDFGAAGTTLDRADSVRSRADAVGISLACIDPVTSWLPRQAYRSATRPTNELQRRYADLFGVYSVDECLRLAEKIGAKVISAIEPCGYPCKDQVVADSFAALCARAEEFGVTVQLEPMSFSALRDVGTAQRIINESHAPNSGIVFDTWHFHRSGADYLRLGILRPESITSIQLCDGPTVPVQDLWDEAGNCRLAPGTESFELARMMDSLTGAVSKHVLIGPEVISSELHRRRPDHVARTMFDACSSLCRQCRWCSDIPGSRQHGRLRRP
ncbi:sugar phosphate isomerase/epimerase [Rhodococcus sp. WS4]|nr:sugar phosphate isomerase/epimerase [Rhodococcus sp. WS4]